VPSALSASPIFFYISGHGFGHASRQIEVINALAPLLPDHSIAIRTSAPRWLFDRTCRTAFTWLEGATDTGAVQVDGLRLDEAATVRCAAAFYRDFPAEVAREATLLREARAAFVVADAPPLACAAAARAGVPAVVLSNFTWDWIYEAYAPAWEEPWLLTTIREAYRAAAAGWRLPMHGGFQTIDPIVDLPFVARHARHDRQTVRRMLSLPLDVPLALSSFGGYGVRDLDPARLDCLTRWAIVLTGRDSPARLPAGVHFVEEPRLYDSGLRYEDLVHAVDVVVTKPGYGIIAECLANGAAILYTSRGRFPEYDVMVEEMPQLMRCAFIGQENLMAGEWLTSLDRLMALPAPAETADTNGAEVVARMIREILH
jgi:hypothetical protein